MAAVGGGISHRTVKHRIVNRIDIWPFLAVGTKRDKRVRFPPEPPVMCGASFDHRGFSKNVAPRTFLAQAFLAQEDIGCEDTDGGPDKLF